MEPTNGGPPPPDPGPSSTGSPDRPRFDVFLSYNSEDREQVRYVAEKLRTAGVRPWVDGASLSPGGDYQRELADGLDDSGACAVFVGQATGGLRWSGTEVRRALNHFNTDPNYRVFAVLLPGIPLSSTDYLNRLPPFLKDVATVVDLRRGPDHEASFSTLILAIKGLPFDAERPAIVADAIESPYRGLFPFAESESGQFFGRSTDLGDLQERLDRRQHEGGPRFLAILGPSGSDRKSVV